MRTTVWITTSFVGHHRWVDAPPAVVFLRQWHRHVFHVRLGVQVSRHDREVEFFQLKARVNDYLRQFWEGRHFEDSCESIAASLLVAFDAVFVEVSEDGENGAVVDLGTNTEVHSAGVLLEKKERCFVGIEAEGPHRGEVVLFVPGSVTPARFDKVWSNGIRRFCVSRVYYGAGNDRNLSREMLELLKQLDFPVDAEGVRLYDSYGDALVGLTTIDLSPGEANCHYRKRIEHNLIIWEGVVDQSRYITAVTDPLFWADFYVEE